MKLQWLGYTAVVLASCSPTRTMQAQERPDPCNRSVVSPYATLKLTLKGERAVFHEGEVIPLEITSTNSLVQFVPKGARPNFVTAFCLMPDGPDPLRDDSESGLWGNGAAIGNPGPYETLNPGVPHVVTTELNEWKSAPPGSYSLRIGTSNEVKFQVVPATPEWQAEQLAKALAVLDAHATNDALSYNDEPRKHAVRVLRFLGSEASTRELARRFWAHDQHKSRPLNAEYPINSSFYGYEREQNYWDFKAGLIGSPYRAVAIQELTAAIHDRQYPATRAMVETLALLEIQSKPEYPRFIPSGQYRQVELQSPTPECPFLFLPCASPPSELEKKRQAKGAAYNDLVAELLKQEQ
jgi:hypothetical protein